MWTTFKDMVSSLYRLESMIFERNWLVMNDISSVLRSKRRVSQALTLMASDKYVPAGSLRPIYHVIV